uniref:Pre-SET domain-containing protein n=1 Tax=Denticeps clupeoides TaxID=299321 RepID=A0AAY4D1F9_9TELE
MLKQANDYTFVINNANGFRVLLLPGMNSEEDEVEMSPDELQQYVYAVVQQNRVVAQRAADVAAIEQWVLHQENEISKNNLLFKNAFESVLECEAKMKDLYSKLGLEYKDSDSEDEGAAKPPTGVIQITDDEEEEEDDAGGTENSSIDHGPQMAPETTSILEVGMSVLGRKRTKTWHSGILKEIRRIGRYKVEFGKRKCLLSGHHVAYEKAAQLKDLFIGARVVARYKEEHQNWLHSAILAELPDRKNRMRFLVFFDDGHSAYVGLPDMHLVHAPCRFLSNNVLEDIEDVAWQHFVQNYLKAYPCVIYVTKPEGEPVEVDYDGQWLPGCIKQVDCSLIKVVLKDDDRTVWLHKGSDRLKHIFQMKERAAEAKKQGNCSACSLIHTHLLRSYGNVISQEISLSQYSTTISHIFPISCSPNVNFFFFITRRQGIKRGPPSPDLPKYSNRLVYTPHRCCPACLDGHRPPTHQPRGRNPLLIPLLHGFRRMTGRCREKQKLVFHVFYRSPCGCSLASMEDVQEFLLQTRCEFLYIDMFCLDPDVLVKRGLGPERQTLFWQQDISKNFERVPVSCVNEVDSFPLPNLAYFTKRIPAFGVNINTHPDFLVGCDCTDGCRDRFKCACQQLTVESTSLCPGGPVDSTVGYTYKRLLKNVPTGIYECNAMCRCDPKMCSNRVVQQDMQVRLQVFKMKQKGWGVRCKDDLARGTFICVLTGRILNESVIGMERNMGGNKHLTSLDYIEAVEHLKEGYESEARCTDDEGGGAEEEGELSEGGCPLFEHRVRSVKVPLSKAPSPHTAPRAHVMAAHSSLRVMG